MTHVADAFGCLYVVEGSTLGGQIISRQVTRNLGLSPDNNGCRFFCCYGENTGTMWRRFGESLETFLTANPDTRPQIVASALSTFECFQGWFAKPSTGHLGI
jgi:heme oxygenase